METVSASLAWLGTTAFRWSAIAFVLLNTAAVVAVFVTRDRSLVNRWTSRLLVADALLLGSGLGIPVVARAARLVVEAVSSSPNTAVSLDARSEHRAEPR
jgi:hypothetical protein